MNGFNRVCLGLIFLGHTVINAVHADTLITENFQVTVTRNCSEGVVVCDQVAFHSIDSRNGRQLRLQGRTWHRYNAEGTPTQYLGYEFTHGNIRVYATERGELIMEAGNDILIQESGEWQ